MKKLHICLAATLGALLVSACASKPTPPPTFDINADAGSQAAQFIEAKDAKYARGAKRVAITSCNVLFGGRSGASSHTGGGLLSSTPSGYSRLDKTVTEIFILQGMEDRQLQAIADSVCAEAERRFESAGFEVVKRGALAENEQFRKMHEKGQPSGYEFKPDGSKTTYRIFTPSGMKVVAGDYLSLSASLKDIWSGSTKGETFAALEGKLIKNLQAAAVHVDVLVDFANLQAQASEGFFGKMLGQDSAKVEKQINLAVQGKMSMATESGLKCFDSYDWGTKGTRTDCWPQDLAVYSAKSGLVAPDKFYTELKDVQSTGSKVAEAATNVLGALMAASGQGGRQIDYRETGVAVNPAMYAELARRYSGSFLEMLTKTAKSG